MVCRNHAISLGAMLMNVKGGARKEEKKADK